MKKPEMIPTDQLFPKRIGQGLPVKLIGFFLFLYLGSGCILVALAFSFSTTSRPRPVVVPFSAQIEEGQKPFWGGVVAFDLNDSYPLFPSKTISVTIAEKPPEVFGSIEGVVIAVTESGSKRLALIHFPSGGLTTKNKQINFQDWNGGPVNFPEN